MLLGLTRCSHSVGWVGCGFSAVLKGLRFRGFQMQEGAYGFKGFRGFGA